MKRFWITLKVEVSLISMNNSKFNKFAAFHFLLQTSSSIIVYQLKLIEPVKVVHGQDLHRVQRADYMELFQPQGWTCFSLVWTSRAKISTLDWTPQPLGWTFCQVNNRFNPELKCFEHAWSWASSKTKWRIANLFDECKIFLDENEPILLVKCCQ